MGWRTTAKVRQRAEQRLSRMPPPGALVIIEASGAGPDQGQFRPRPFHPTGSSAARLCQRAPPDPADRGRPLQWPGFGRVGCQWSAALDAATRRSSELSDGPLSGGRPGRLNPRPSLLRSLRRHNHHPVRNQQRPGERHGGFCAMLSGRVRGAGHWPDSGRLRRRRAALSNATRPRSRRVRSHGHVRGQGSGLEVHGQFSGSWFGSKV